MTKINLNDWLIESTRLLASHSEFASIETRVVLCFVLQKSREWVITHPEVDLEESQVILANKLVNQLMIGEPLPYLVGKQAFFGLDFMVNREVLIPRPETELLIEECITWLEDHPTKRKLADIGTGSGAIAITLADRFEDLEITAIDISEKALEVARKNAYTLNVAAQIEFKQNDLLEGFQGRFDVIAANLPYIPSDILKSLPVTRYEPTLALDGGSDGLVLIQRLIEQAQSHINPGGLIVLEFEENQSDGINKLVKTILPGTKSAILNDLANHPRILKIQV